MSSSSLIWPATAKNTQKAIDRLLDGQLMALPTETVYGLAADATNDMAVAKIFDAKERPQFNPLIVHIDNANYAKNFVEIDDKFLKLTQAFWPGPLTLILPRKANCPISPLCSSGGYTLAVRSPQHPLFRSILVKSNLPIAAPSANRANHISPTKAEHVLTSLDRNSPPILDGGPCTYGLESTVVDLSGSQPVLLRPGVVTSKQLEAVLDILLDTPTSMTNDNLKSPGQMKTHYAPKKPVFINQTFANSTQGFLAFGPHQSTRAKISLNLSETGDFLEASANLFDYLYRLEQSPIASIAIAPIPAKGLGIAINDRITRAATPLTKDTLND